jgi:hypothetical protein
MSLQFRCAVILVLGLSLTGCRQADGPIPTPNAATQNEIDDMSRDLLGIANRDAESQKYLSDDLQKYTEESSNYPAFNELARRTSAVVQGSKLSELAAKQLAHDLWLVVSAREMSERQVEALQMDFQTVLVSAGVPEQNVQPVTEQVVEVQRLVTSRPRRWYEFF